MVIVGSGGSLVYKGEGLTLSRLLRILWDYRPDKLGVDNVFELAEDERRLLKVLSLMPPRLEVVQVTLIDGVFLDIREVARRAGLLEDYSKMAPLKTAHTAALLACSGYGSSVRAVEERTVVQVSRLRSPSSGGWSQQRYQRRVRALVQSAALSIREALDRAGLDYDYFYRESKGGLESAVFTVYAPLSSLEGLIEEVEGPDYMVRVKPVYRSKLLIAKPQDAASRPIIVGLDPGANTGIAIVDLEGRVLHVTSGRNLDRGSILDIVSGYGKPVIIAVDVSEPPETVRKLAAQLGASIYTPPRDMSILEKRDIIEEVIGRVKPENSHERDALAAAYKAYISMKNKLQQIDSQLEDLEPAIDKDEVKKWVIRGLTMAEALEKALEKALEESTTIVKREPGRGKPRKEAPQISEYVREIEFLKAQREALEAKIRTLEESIREWEKKFRELQQNIRAEALRDAEIEKLRNRVRDLEKLIEEQRLEKESLMGKLEESHKLLKTLAKGELVAARRLKTLTTKALKKSEETLGPIKQGELIHVDNLGIFEEEAVNKLKQASVKAVITESTETPPAPLRNAMIPVLKLGNYKHIILEDLTLTDPKTIEDAEEERRKLEKERPPPDIEKIIKEYRAKRMLRRA